MPKRNSQPDYRHLIDVVAARLYGAAPDASWIPSDEADVFRLNWRDRRQARILKIQRPEMGWVVWREQALIPALRARGFSEVPVVEHTQDDLKGIDVIFMIMLAAPSVDLAAAYRQSPRQLADAFARLGDFLRWLGEPHSRACLGWPRRRTTITAERGWGRESRARASVGAAASAPAHA